MQSTLIAATLVLVALTGCSSDSTTSSSSSSFKCCVNGSYYDCKTQDEMKTCGTTSMACPADPSKNDLCK